MIALRMCREMHPDERLAERFMARWCSVLVSSARLAYDNSSTGGTNLVWKGLVQICRCAANCEEMISSMEPVQTCLIDSLRLALDALLDVGSPSEFEEKLCWVRYGPKYLCVLRKLKRVVQVLCRAFKDHCGKQRVVDTAVWNRIH